MAASFYVCRNILQNHNSVVHHHTNTDGECRQRYDVDGVTREIEIDKRANERNGDGNHDDDGSPPSTQKKQHNDTDNDQGKQNGFEQTTDGYFHIIRRIHDGLNVNVGRQILLVLWQQLFHCIDDIHSIGSRLFLNHDGSTAPTVCVTFHDIRLNRIVYGGHISQIDALTLADADHHVIQCIAFLYFTLKAQHVGLRTHIEVSGRDVHVFGSNFLSNLFQWNIVGLQLFGDHIHLHFSLGRSGDGNCTYTRYSVKRPGNLVIEDFIQCVGALVGCG